MEKTLQVIHEHCIHCGVCVMMGYAYNNKEGKKYIKADLPKEQWSQAENNCPVGAIQQVQEDEGK